MCYCIVHCYCIVMFTIYSIVLYGIWNAHSFYFKDLSITGKVQMMSKGVRELKFTLITRG